MYLTANSGFRSVYTWQTGLREAHDGTEQRECLASLPRARYDGAIFLDAADLAAARTLLHASAASAFDLPLPFETVASVNAITGTTITIVPTYTDWNVVGRKIYVRRADGTAYTTTINTVGGGGATLTVDDSPPAGTWAAGTTMITPIETVLFEEGQALSRFPRAAGMFNVRARQSTARALTGTGSGSIAQHDSLDLLPRRHTDAAPQGEQLRAGVTFRDAGGAVASSADWTQAKEQRTLSFVVQGAQQRQWWKKWLTQRKGRVVTFLCPTWRPDLLKITMNAGATSFTVDATYADYLTKWWPSLAHRRVQVEKSDGTVFYRTITAAADLGSNVTQLDCAALPDPIGTVTCISFLELCRLDTDEVSFEWREHGTAIVRLPIVVVQG